MNLGDHVDVSFLKNFWIFDECDCAVVRTSTCASSFHAEGPHESSSGATSVLPSAPSECSAGRAGGSIKASETGFCILAGG